jgi:hypothetical protein
VILESRALAGVVVLMRHPEFRFHSRSRLITTKGGKHQSGKLYPSRGMPIRQPVLELRGQRKFPTPEVVSVAGRRLRCGPGEQCGLASIEDRESSKSAASFPQSLALQHQLDR